MIPVIEDYLSELLEDRLLYLRQNPNHLYTVLGINQARLKRLNEYLQNKPVKVIKGFPRTPAELPCICILLSNEEESQEGLGDIGAEDDYDTMTNTEQLSVVDTLGGELNTPYIQVTNKPISSIKYLKHVEFGTILDPSDYEIVDEYQGLISINNGMVEHDDTIEIEYNYHYKASELMRVLYESSYRLEVWGDNADLVVELYHLVKWALLSGRDKLGEVRELFRQKLSGADFQPAPSYFPVFVYRRALTFWCQYSASTINRTEEYIAEIKDSDATIYEIDDNLKLE